MIILLLALAMTAVMMGATIVAGVNETKAQAQKVRNRK